MDRQRIDRGSPKSADGIKDWVGRPVGDRHPRSEFKTDKNEAGIPGGIDQAMDAVREVVNKEQAEKDEQRRRSRPDRAMDAVREVVAKE